MKIEHLLLSVLGFGMPIIFQSCDFNDDNTDFQGPTALVTVCPRSDGGFVMQLDDDTQLIPVNLKTSPFGEKEVRALVNYKEADVSDSDAGVREVLVSRIDSIRTKLPVESAGELDDVRYGNDPIEIVKDWVTVAEDGYLTLRVRTLWGAPQTQHVISLVSAINPEDPYELELRHDAKGDKNGRWGDALIAFNLNGLPRINSDVVTVSLKWKSFDGDKSTKFELKMRPVGE